MPDPQQEPPIEVTGPAGDAAAAPDDAAEDDEDIDVDDLRKAPSHAADIEAKIKQVFPGSELEILPDPDEGGS